MNDIRLLLLSLGFIKFERAKVYDSYDFSGLHRYIVTIHETFVKLYKDWNINICYNFEDFKVFIANEKDFVYITRKRKISKLLNNG